MTVDPDFDSLLDAAAPAVLTTYRRDGSALVSPVWFRRAGDALEVVIAAGDFKLKHLAHTPQSSLTIFETTPPFRGVRISGEPEIITGDVTETRLAIAGRYLGASGGASFVEQRKPQGTIVRFRLDDARTWDLRGILPDG